MNKTVIHRVLAGLLGMTGLVSAPAFSQTLDQLVQEALAANQQLMAQTNAVEASLSGLDEARARFMPSVGINARYTRAEGGRTIDFPIGDVLNPVYQNLNQINAANGSNVRYPTLENQSFKLLRPREQDTRLTVSAPLYVPGLDAQVKARQALLMVAQSGREVVARQLVRDMKVAYWSYSQAQAQQNVLLQSLKVLEENERIANVLLKNGRATRDLALRAQAEKLGVELQVQQSKNAQAQSQRYINLLRNAAPETPVTLSDDLAQLKPTRIPGDVDTSKRPELVQLAGQLSAVKASEQAVSASFKPTVVLAADAGYQGVDYGARGPGAGVATASVLLNWTLADFGVRSSLVNKAQQEQKQLRNQLAYARQQLTLAALSARDNINTAIVSIETADSRVKAAQEAFRIASRKRDEGLASQVEFFDAERALTEARQSAVIARLQYQNNIAELEFATASYALQPVYLNNTPTSQGQ